MTDGGRTEDCDVRANTAVADYQDSICALRLAVWTLERSTTKDGVDPLPVVELIVRRAEYLRRLLEAEIR